MSIIQTIVKFFTRHRRQSASSAAANVTDTFPARGIDRSQVERPPARGSRTVPARRNWENPTGEAATSARSDDDVWPSPVALVDQLPPAAAAPAHKYDCPAPARYENVLNHESFQSPACDRDDYNRNASSGTPNFGGAADPSGSLD